MAKVVKVDTEKFIASGVSAWGYLSLDEAHKANTFLSAAPAGLFSSILDIWQSFFDIFLFGIPSSKVGCFYGSLKTQGGTGAMMPGSLNLELEPQGEIVDAMPALLSAIPELSCIYGFSANDAEGFVLLNRHDVLKLTEGFFDALGANSFRLKATSKEGKILTSGNNFVEYLVHRFLWSLFRSWKGSLPVSYTFQGVVKPESLSNYSGEVIVLSLDFPFMPLDVVIIPPKNLLPDFFASARSQLPYRSFSVGDVSDNLRVRFTAALCRLSVDPSQLVDFLRPEAVVDLGDAVNFEETLIFLNQKEQGRAKVMSSGDHFLLRFLDDISSECRDDAPVSGNTHILIALVDEVVSGSTLLSSTRYYSSVTRVSTKVALLIGGEVVAKAELGTYAKRNAIRILARDAG